MHAPRPVLALITHVTDRFWQRRYLVQLMIPRWETLGFRVVIVTDADPFLPADVALLHVDLSVVPDSCRRLAERYPRVINGGVLDIRKRHFSQLLVDRDGPDPGKVIVKTNWNCGGIREFQRAFLESPMGQLLERLHLGKFVCRKLVRREQGQSWQRTRILPTSTYPVYLSRALVPAGVWQNPNLVVERFVAECDGENYCCRHWLFFGTEEVGRRTLSPHPVIKFDAQLERLADPVPGELRVIRQRLGFDYGKFDYGIVDGEVVLYDVNRTPGAATDPARHTETVDVLANGIDSFCNQQPSARSP